MMQPPDPPTKAFPRDPADPGRIVLVGASVRAAAESAKRAGYTVIGIDLFGDTDTLAACDQHFFLSSDFREQIQAACLNTPVLQVSGLSNHPTWAWFPQTPRLLKEPSSLAKIACSAQVNFPETGLQSDLDSGPAFVSARWLVKQVDSSGGLGVSWFRPHTCPENAVLQRWIPGRLFGASFISNGTDSQLIGVCQGRFTRAGSELPFVHCGSLGPIHVPPEMAQRLGRIGREVVAMAGLRGLFNVDFLIDQHGTFWLLEINPRWSSSMELIERNLQAPLLSVMLNGSSRLPDLELRASDLHLKRIVFARHRVEFQRNRISALENSRVSFHDVPADGTVIERGNPILTVIKRFGVNEKSPMKNHRALMRCIHGEPVSP
ncbi:MAG: ATP-grasp domain-containing protein [Rubripirellula sp.]